MMDETLVEKLKDVGMNTYEAKVYLALLQHHPATGYEVSKDSGVPQARAYDTLKALASRQVVVAIDGRPITYSPISPERLIDRWERAAKESMGFLRDSLPRVSSEMVEPVFNLRGDAAMFERARYMIHKAEESIFLETWQEDIPEMEEALAQAASRGVQLKIVGYNNVRLGFGEVYQHGLAETIEENLGGRWLIMATDNTRGLVGTVPKGKPATQAVYTKNPGLVLVIKELIVHDIFLLDVEHELQGPLEKVYGKDLIKLRQKILGDELKFCAH